VQEIWQERIAAGLPEAQALEEAGDSVVLDQLKSVAIPKRFSIPMRELWRMQPRFERRNRRRAQRMLGHPRFRAAYDFLLLRAEVGDAPAELGEWWSEFVAGQPDQLPPNVDPAPPRRRRRRRRRSE